MYMKSACVIRYVRSCVRPSPWEFHFVNQAQVVVQQTGAVQYLIWRTEYQLITVLVYNRAPHLPLITPPAHSRTCSASSAGRSRTTQGQRSRLNRPWPCHVTTRLPCATCAVKRKWRHRHPVEQWMQVGVARRSTGGQRRLHDLE